MAPGPDRRSSGRITDLYEGWGVILTIAVGLGLLVVLGYILIGSSDDATRATRESNVRAESRVPPQTYPIEKAPN